MRNNILLIQIIAYLSLVTELADWQLSSDVYILIYFYYCLEENHVCKHVTLLLSFIFIITSTGNHK